MDSLRSLCSFAANEAATRFVKALLTDGAHGVTRPTLLHSPAKHSFAHLSASVISPLEARRGGVMIVQLQNPMAFNPQLTRLLFALLAALAFNAAAVTHYVDLNSPSPTPPYTNWLTAATNIQDAVDAAVDGDIVLVTNGVYATGGRLASGSALTNRVVITQAITVQSVNGYATTIIQGNAPVSPAAVRCVYLADNATLIGFTLTNGATRGSGAFSDISAAGAWCESSNSTISSCLIVSNTAASSGSYGGGVGSGVNYGGAGNHGNGVGSIVRNCIISQNSAAFGGGAIFCVLDNCLLAFNKASQTGAAAAGSILINCTVYSNSSPATAVIFDSTLENSIVYYNPAPSVSLSIATNCCVQGGGAQAGNFTNAPLFKNILLGDLRLQTNSPCINAGKNSFVANTTDFDGNPRISGGTVDIGAYEFQSPTSVLSYAWAQQNGLPTDGLADFTDADGDGANNWQEWRADTSPTNVASALLMGTATNGVTGLVVSWASVATRSYWLERGADLSVASPFQTIATNIPGVAGTKTYNDTSATNGGPYFYRVGVQ